MATLVGANIADARKLRKLTQQQVATELKTSISRVSGWERGEHLPSRSTQGPLAELLFGGDVTAMFREPERAAA